MSFLPPRINKISTDNSTSTPLNDGATFTGTGEDVSMYDSIIVSVATDQDGEYTVEFSNDNINWDSVLTRYYRMGQINVPHRFTITRQYCRITFTNDSGSNQTYLRLQTSFGSKGDLNIPIDSTMSQDFDAIATRPSDFHTEVALSRRQGASTVNKFGYNLDIDTGSEEILAPWGGTFDPTTDIMSTAQTFDITYNSTNDGFGKDGARSLLIDYLDSNNELQSDIHVLGLTGSDTTSFSGLGINRVVVLSTGGDAYNANDITIEATTDKTVQAVVPAEASVTQQCIYHTPIAHTFLIEWLYFSPSGSSGFFFPTGAKVNIKAYSWSRVTEARYDVGNLYYDVTAGNGLQLAPPVPFVIGGREVVYVTATTDTNNTELSGRFSGELVRNVDA